MTKKAVIYTRVSSDDQAEHGYSLPHQVNECRRYAELHDFSVLEEFYDDYSGATLERPGFSQLQEFIAQNRVDAVIVYTADRLSRNIIDFLVLRDQWEKAGLELHYVDRGRSQNNFEGLLTDGIFAIIAHGERLKIIERTSNGRYNKARNNRVVMIGIPPYGYKKIGIGKDAEYVIDPYKAEIVKNIFDWYVNGYGQKGPLSLREISNLLDEMGVETPDYRPNKQAPFWHARTVAFILQNPIYIGITYYGKEKTVDGKRTKRPKNEWIRIEVPHLAFISKEVFDLAEKRAERNKEIAKRNRKRTYLMTGHFRCAACGKGMVGYVRGKKSGGPKEHYRCGSRFHKGNTCDALKSDIVASRVDTAIWDWVTSLLEDENNLDEGIRAMMEKRAQEFGPKQERLETIESLLLGTEERIKRLVDELSEYEGYAVRDIIREKINAIESERGLLFEEREKLTRELEQMDLAPDFEEQIKITASKIRAKLSGATFEDKRMVLDALEMKVKYHYDQERGDILLVSCNIPFIEGAIELHPSPRWSHSRCRCWTRNLPTSRRCRWRRSPQITKRN